MSHYTKGEIVIRRKYVDVEMLASGHLHIDEMVDAMTALRQVRSDTLSSRDANIAYVSDPRVMIRDETTVRLYFDTEEKS